MDLRGKQFLYRDGRACREMGAAGEANNVHEKGLVEKQDTTGMHIATSRNRNRLENMPDWWWKQSDSPRGMHR